MTSNQGIPEVILNGLGMGTMMINHDQAKNRRPGHLCDLWGIRDELMSGSGYSPAMIPGLILPANVGYSPVTKH